MADTPTLARFHLGFEEDGVGKDGMPQYREVLKITLARPPYLEITRVADEQDFDDYPDPYKLFQREQKGKAQTGAEGYPLIMWPALNEADLQSCLIREIYTVEQLALVAKRGDRGDVPPSIMEMARAPSGWSSCSAKPAATKRRPTSWRAKSRRCREQNNEFRAQLDAANSLIATLKARAAA